MRYINTTKCIVRSVQEMTIFFLGRERQYGLGRRRCDCLLNFKYQSYSCTSLLHVTIKTILVFIGIFFFQNTGFKQSSYFGVFVLFQSKIRLNYNVYKVRVKSFYYVLITFYVSATLKILNLPIYVSYLFISCGRRHIRSLGSQVFPSMSKRRTPIKTLTESQSSNLLVPDISLFLLNGAFQLLFEKINKKCICSTSILCR